MRILKFRLIKDNKIVSTQELKPIEWDTACQFTGLLDKFGKEIYEGDIVSVTKLKVTIFWQVIYDRWGIPACACRGIESTDFKELEMLCGIISYKHIEIVGNIYENPDLLKEKTK